MNQFVLEYELTRCVVFVESSEEWERNGVFTLKVFTLVGAKTVVSMVKKYIEHFGVLKK